MTQQEQATIKISKADFARLSQDRLDMMKTTKTMFYRCSCGRMRERGVVCVNKDCKDKL